MRLSFLQTDEVGSVILDHCHSTVAAMVPVRHGPGTVIHLGVEGHNFDYCALTGLPLPVVNF